MQNLYTILSTIGLSAKEINIYIVLLKTGPLSVRKIAEEAGLNRGTTYDALKNLQTYGLVAYFNKEKHKYFAAEDPEKLGIVFGKRIQELKVIEDDVRGLIPELKSMYEKGGDKPVMRLYEGVAGVRTILEDVLAVMRVSKHKEYYVYSPREVRDVVYKCFEDFGKARVDGGIHVKTVALGTGGALAGLDERRWIKNAEIKQPTYTLIYEGKVAFVTFDSAKKPVGLIIDNDGIYEMHKFVFLELWKTLK